MGATGDCGCGPSKTMSSGAVALDGAAYLRPQFFADQLLTQDDLQGVVDYTLAKRRLTNRHLFGAGVVCGLDVSCHPCEPGMVRVQPGYAIEGCGNDIVVSCPEDVDVLRLVREYRLANSEDCGEPCGENPRRDFHLYIRYQEEPTAPLAPYVSDDCAAGDCEFSRYREGYRFELRCGMPAGEPTLCSVLAAAKPDEDDDKEDLRRMKRVLRFATKQSDVLAKLAAAPEAVPAIPTRAEFDEFGAGELPLPKAIDVLKHSIATLALDAAAAKGGAPSPGLTASRRKVIADGSAALAARVLASPEFTALPDAEQAQIAPVLKLAEEQPDLSNLTPVGRAWLDEGVSEYDAARMYVTDAERLKGRVLSKLEGSSRSRCAEARELAKLRFDGLHAGSKADAEVLGNALVRSFDDAVCAAVNPPCPVGGDPAVPLAKLRVEGCEVTDVCALERQFVLSPRALGYWVPIVERFRTELAASCCGCACGCDGDGGEGEGEGEGDIEEKVRDLESGKSLAAELGKLLQIACPPDSSGKEKRK